MASTRPRASGSRSRPPTPRPRRGSDPGTPPSAGRASSRLLCRDRRAKSLASRRARAWGAVPRRGRARGRAPSSSPARRSSAPSAGSIHCHIRGRFERTSTSMPPPSHAPTWRRRAPTRARARRRAAARATGRAAAASSSRGTTSSRRSRPSRPVAEVDVVEQRRLERDVGEVRRAVGEPQPARRRSRSCARRAGRAGRRSRRRAPAATSTCRARPIALRRPRRRCRARTS